jgi:gentisate 1,2-dioxygenase
MTPSNSSELQQFKEAIDPLNLLPLWERQMKLLPGSHCVPAHWAYQAVRPLLEKSVALISKKDADRRVLVMENPSLKGSSFISQSLYAGQQIIMPGEIAPSHRHSPNALRFLVEGEGAYTSVDGVKMMMRPGDFVVTPNFTWHDHGNEGSQAVVWMDGLDTPFTSLFGAHFRENYPQDIYPVTHTSQRLDQHCASLIYPWESSLDCLSQMPTSQMDPVHGFKLRYINPKTGKDPLTTIAAFMQMLPKGFRGKTYRSTEHTVMNVAQGSCILEVGSQTYHLATHDVMVVPSWEPYRFLSSDMAVIFSFSDRCAQQALGFWREEYLVE